MNLIYKLLSSHLIEGELKPGNSVRLCIDQTLTQDALGMLAYLALEQTGVDHVKTELSVSYQDHNLLYTDYRNPDDHAYLNSIAEKYGIVVSRPGNGICHSVHLARFAKPGKLLIGTDSHTPSAGAIGMLGIGAGGMDVAAVMAGEPLILNVPKVIEIRLEGKLPPEVNAKDAALRLMQLRGVKGGTGCAYEFTGPALAELTVEQRLTLANMSAESGATTAIFPSDEQTLRFLSLQGRAEDFQPLAADPDAHYDDTVILNLSELEPLTAVPHQPDNVLPVSAIRQVRVDQVFIGSCTNCSYSDLMRAAAVLKGKRAADHVSLLVSPGTRQNYLAMLDSGAMSIFVKAGARILECGCGPCVGLGQAPPTGGVTVRTTNRNFKGRCGTADSQTYLVSPEVAARTAVEGVLSAPEEAPPRFDLNPFPVLDDSLLVFNPGDPDATIRRGPNIRPIPTGSPLPDNLRGGVAIRLGDNISTDEIAPAGAVNVANRANIEVVSHSTFERIDPHFAERAKVLGTSFIVAGENYGQGSSREHAALMPMYLGVRGVIAAGFARIHRTNLINFGLLPLTASVEVIEQISQGDVLSIQNLHDALTTGVCEVCNETTHATFHVSLQVSDYERQLLLAGGMLRYIQSKKGRNPQ